MMIRILTLVPPAAANTPPDEVCAFAENDPYGGLMALMGMGIVFAALILLYIIFSNTPKLHTVSFKSKLRGLLSFRRTVRVVEPEPQPAMETPDSLTGEVNAAIAAAIHLYREELHDYEDTVLTIKKVSRTYSPWSSKIYGVRHPFGRN